jgi:hypothetical protein
MPDSAYKHLKRNSVFHKVDVKQLNLDSIPVFKKSKKELQEIIPLLNQNFLAKNLQENELEKIAGSMKPESFKKDDLIIRYGDQGMTYYILSKGNVKVTVYQDGTDPNDPDLKSKEKFTKILE